MDQRRFVLFITLSMGILLVWTQFIAPKFFPPPPLVQQDQAKEKAAKKDEVKKTKGKDAIAAAAKTEPAAKPGDAAKQPEKKDAAKPALDRHARREIVLGSSDPRSGYYVRVRLTSLGAAVQDISLNDPRYRELDRRDELLKVVGNGENLKRTFETAIPAIDDQLEPFGHNLRDVHWKVKEGSEKFDAEAAAAIGAGGDKGAESKVANAVEFVFLAPDRKLEVTKRFEVVRGEANDRDARDAESAPYCLKMKITLRNLGDAASKITYNLQGPVGVPLENPETTRVHRRIQTSFYREDRSGRTTNATLTAKQIVKADSNGKIETWRSPVKYLGVDAQYFAALIIPDGDQQETTYTSSVKAEVVAPAADANNADVSLEIKSVELPIPPQESVSHEYQLYAGPKREDLLAPYSATSILEHGDYFGWVARGMLWILHKLHRSLSFPYWLAIISLTVIVRGAMFPLSRKQAISAQRMKELQPKLAELKKKYGNDREKFAMAQMQLFRESNYNPLSGCLPLIVQLPIFIGLYTALSTSLDLRMAPFLWVPNLAAPDALFRLPFKIWPLGHFFNLLPVITMALFVFQQKMFMPPPVDEQQRMQHKMMMWMSIAFGFMFWNVPAGLCLYFIASSLWGLGERKLLDKYRQAHPEGSVAAEEVEATAANRSKKSDDEPEAKPRGAGGFWEKLLAKADEAAAAAGQSKPKALQDDSKRGGKPRSASSRRKNRRF